MGQALAGIVLAVWGVVASMFGACAEQPASDPKAAQPAAEQPAVIEGKPQVVVTDVLPPIKLPGPLNTPELLLKALQKAQASAKSLQADIKLDQLKEIAGDRKVRFGKWYYQDDRKPDGTGVRKTGAKFDTLLLGNVKHDDVQIYVFDGEWLVEKRPTDKQIVKKRIGKPGEQVDPLSVDGPLPVPIGQDPDRVLNRFDAVVDEAGADLEPNDPEEKAGFEKFVKGTYQLRLKLKEAFAEDSEIRDVRLWYLPDANGQSVQPLPRLLRVENRAGDVTFLQLIQVRKDESIPPDVLDVTVPADWKANIR